MWWWLKCMFKVKPFVALLTFFLHYRDICNAKCCYFYRANPFGNILRIGLVARPTQRKARPLIGQGVTSGINGSMLLSLGS